MRNTTKKEKTMNYFRVVSLAAMMVLLAGGVIGITATPVAAATVRPTMVRDVDNGALQPFKATGNVNFTALFSFTDLATVPVGKRLVIEHVSWTAAFPNGSPILQPGLYDSNNNILTYLNTPAPVASLVAHLQIQNSSEPVKIYLEPGEVLRFGASNNYNTAIPTTLNVVVQGYYVTL
jgi:hypothetical protein